MRREGLRAVWQAGHVGPTRRQLLVAGAATLASAAACTSRGDKGPPSVDPTAAAVQSVRAAAVAREVALLQAYADALAGQPTLAAALGPVVADHTAHLQQLSPGAVPPTARPVIGRRPPAAVVASLRQAELQAATKHATAAESAVGESPCGQPLAPVLASLAACESVHALQLLRVAQSLTPPSPSPTPEQTRTATPRATRTPSASPTPSPRASTRRPTASPRPSKSSSPRPSKTASPRPSATAT